MECPLILCPILIWSSVLVSTESSSTPQSILATCSLKGALTAAPFRGQNHLLHNGIFLTVNNAHFAYIPSLCKGMSGFTYVDCQFRNVTKYTELAYSLPKSSNGLMFFFLSEETYSDLTFGDCYMNDQIQLAWDCQCYTQPSTYYSWPCRKPKDGQTRDSGFRDEL